MTFLTNLSLWKKITILTLFGLGLGVGVFSTLGMRAVNEATEAMLQERLTTAHLVADYVDESLVRAMNALENSARIIETKGTVDDFSMVVAALNSEYSRLSVEVSEIYLVNQEGRVLYSFPQLLTVQSLNMALFQEVSEAIEKNIPSISRKVVGPGTGSPVIFLTTPVNLPQESEKYGLSVAIDLARSNIGIFVQPLKLGKTGYVEIVDQNGVVIIRTEPGPKLQPFEKSDHAGRFVALIDAGKPTRGICHTCHEARQTVAGKDVLAFVPLSQAHWGVVVRQSEVEALAPANKLNQNLIFYGLGLVSVALLFVLVTTRDVGRRIQVLTAASRKIANGDLSSPVAALGKDEVGILARTFDDMRSKLQTSYGNLQQKTRELASLLSVSEILTSPQDLSSLLDAVTAKAVEVIYGADAGVLLIESTDHRDLKVQYTFGVDKELLSAEASGPGSGVVTTPEIYGENERVEEAIAKILHSQPLKSRVKNSMHSEVFQKNRCIGSLIILSYSQTKPFADSDHRLLQAIADDIAIAIERAQLAREADEARALHETDKLRSQFISSVSHELRTPLTIIKGYATSLLRRNVNWNKETQLEFLKNIDEKTDELRELIDKILQSAKLEAGALKLEKEPILIPRIAQKIVEETSLRTKKHKFIVAFPQSFPVVEADARCIEQVVRNLVENAIKYSPAGGNVVIEGQAKEGEVIVSVSDNGVGIPTKYQDKIFERFFRVDDPLTRTITGSGLGLSISKGHIKAHNGNIWFESEPGKGSKFFFSLPLNQMEEYNLNQDEESENGGEN